MNDNATILVVDDTSESLALLVKILTAAGYQVRPADSSESALAAVTANQPDLILLDVRMKGMDGLEVCRRLKSREETRQIPIILISAFAEVKEWVEGLKLGAVDYITKPFQPEELLTRVKTHLDLSRAHVSLEQQATALRQTDEQLKSEIVKRQLLEDELRRSLDDVERSHRTLLNTLEDQERTEKALQKSEKMYRLIAENMMDLITVTDMNLRFTYVSPSIIRIRGFTVEEAMTQTLEQVMTPESMQIVFRAFEEEMQLEASGTADPDRIRIMELEEYHKDGSTVWLENTFSFIRDRDRKPEGILVLTRDVTERRRAEELLSKEKNFIDLVINNLPGIFYLFDENGHFLRWNRNFEIITGYSSEEMEKINPLDFFSGEEKKLVGEVLQEALAKGESDVEANLIPKDGKIIPYYFKGLCFISDSRPYFIGLGIDITKRRQAEAARRKSEEEFKAIANYAASWEAWFNPEGKLLWINPYSINLTGYTPEEYMAAEDLLSMAIAEEDSAKVSEIFQDALRGNSGDNLEIRILRKDGSKFWASVSWQPILDSNGRSIGFRTSAKDITLRKRIETERERLITELQSAIEQIKTLRGIVPICSSCKKIRNDKGYWEQVETYVSKHSEAQFSHGICSDCMKKLYPEFCEDDCNQ